jgi:hypothetical protein
MGVAIAVGCLLGRWQSIKKVFCRLSAIAFSSYSSRLRRGKRCWKSWEEMNERSHSSAKGDRIQHLQEQIMVQEVLLPILGVI